ncbi:MAG: glycosyltransferase family 1 protein [Patescibacteria group bacterium]
MRIIVDARPFALPLQGGVGRVAQRLIRAYALEFPQDELVLATTGWIEPELPDDLRLPNVRRCHLKIPNKLWSALAMLGAVSLARAVEKKTGAAEVFFMPNLGFVGRLPRDMPAVLLLHDLSFLIEPRWFTRKDRLWHHAVGAKHLIRNAARLLAVSETTKQDTQRLLGVEENKIKVIQMGTTLDADGETREPQFAGRYLLALGLGDPRKNAANAIEAVKALRQEVGFEDLELVLIGQKNSVILSEALAQSKDLYQPSVQTTCIKVFRQAQDDGTRPGRMACTPTWIHPIARPSDAELAALYSGAAAFLYPSWYEGYGLPLHEAARCGTPCIASTSGALPETATPGTIFANPAKPQHWVQAIKLALTQPKPAPPAVMGWENAAKELNRAFRDRA